VAPVPACAGEKPRRRRFFRRLVPWSNSFLHLFCIQLRKIKTIHIPSLNFQLFWPFSFGDTAKVAKSVASFPELPYSSFLSDCNEIWMLWTDFRNILKYQISWKSLRWEPNCSFRTNRRIEMTKLLWIFGCFDHFRLEIPRKLQKVWHLSRNYPTRHSFPIVMRLEFYGPIFEIFSSIKFRENPLGGSRVGTNRQIVMTKLIVAFVNFTKAHNNSSITMLTWTGEQSLMAKCCIRRAYLRQWSMPSVPIKYDILSCCSQYGIEDVPGILCSWKFFSHLPLRNDWQAIR